MTLGLVPAKEARKSKGIRTPISISVLQRAPHCSRYILVPQSQCPHPFISLLSKSLKAEVPQVPIGIRKQFLELHVVEEVGPETGSLEGGNRVLQVETGKHILLDLQGGCGGQSHTWGMCQAGAQGTQTQVVRTEVVPPLGNTMSFIHHQVGEQVAGHQRVQGGLEGGGSRHLWRDVQKFGPGLFLLQVREQLLLLLGRELRVQGTYSYLQGQQVVHLVLRIEGGQATEGSITGPQDRRKSF